MNGAWTISRKPTRRLAGCSCAFTLIELLVVIAIIVILAGLGSFVMNSASRARGVDGGVNVTSSILNQARMVAMNSGASARCYITTDDEAGDRRRRYLTIALMNEDETAWEEISPGVILPESVFVDPEFTTGLETGEFVRSSGANQDGLYIEFNTTGQLTSDKMIRVVVAAGTFQAGDYIKTATSTESGLLVRKLGRVTYLKNPADATINLPP